MPENNNVAAALLAGCRATHNTFVTVQRADVVTALGSVPPEVLDHESHPESQFVIVRRAALVAAAVPTAPAAHESDQPDETGV